MVEYLIAGAGIWGRMNGGWGNGYVIVDDDHPYFGRSQSIPVVVHGGITYSELIRRSTLVIMDSQVGKWMFGFDTNNPNNKNWTEEMVLNETLNLQKQFIMVDQIKKILYKNNPKAKFLYFLGSIAYYSTPIVIDDKSTNLYFHVPMSEMGSAKFEDTMDSKYLIRWIVLPEYYLPESNGNN